MRKLNGYMEEAYVAISKGKNVMAQYIANAIVSFK
jgi:hypothetical protein